MTNIANTKRINHFAENFYRYNFRTFVNTITKALQDIPEEQRNIAQFEIDIDFDLDGMPITQLMVYSDVVKTREEILKEYAESLEQDVKNLQAFIAEHGLQDKLIIKGIE